MMNWSDLWFKRKSDYTFTVAITLLNVGYFADGDSLIDKAANHKTVKNERNTLYTVQFIIGNDFLTSML